MELLRTPEVRFQNIGFDFASHYSTINGPGDAKIRVHHIDEGPRDGEVLLCLHGEPSWSFLYRKVIPYWVQAGYRVIAFDLVGFGKSDKPGSRDDLTYTRQVDWTQQWLNTLNLQNINLVLHDWGGMIGMRLLAADMTRFKRLIAGNTLLLDSADMPPEIAIDLERAFSSMPVPSAIEVKKALAEKDPIGVVKWVKYATQNPQFTIRDVFKTIAGITNEESLAGYEAPFPNANYMAGPISFPKQFPIFPHHQPEVEENSRVWKKLQHYTSPVFTIFSDNDPVTHEQEKMFQQRLPGAKGIEHRIIKGVGHYLQDEAPEEFAKAVLAFLKTTS